MSPGTLDLRPSHPLLRPPAPGSAWRRQWRRGRALAALHWRSGELSRRGLLGAPLLAIAFAIAAFGGVYGWAYGSAYGLIYVALGLWCVQWARGRHRAHWRWTYLPMAAFGLLALAQGALGWSAVPAATHTALVHLGAAGAVFVLVSQCYGGDRDVGWLGASFSVATAALALLAIAQLLTFRHGLYWRFQYALASPAGSFVNRNHFAGCMEMLIPLACAAAYQRRRRPWLRLVPWAAAPALGVAAVLLAASRGGAAALAVEAFAGLLILVYLERIRPPQGRQSRFLVILVAALTLAFALLVGTQAQRSRLHMTAAPGSDITARAQLNRSSLDIFAARPLAGWGLGTWSAVYPAFAHFAGGNVYEFAHNDYLQLLAETGLAGAGLALGFWVIWAGALLERLRRWPPALLHSPGGAPAAIPLALGAGLGCAGLLVQAGVSFNLHIPANLLLFFALAALALPPRA